MIGPKKLFIQDLKTKECFIVDEKYVFLKSDNPNYKTYNYSGLKVKVNPEAFVEVEKQKDKYFTYLIQQNDFYKIGLTKNLKKRFDSYETHNIDFNIVGYIKGDFEKELQNKFKQYHYKKEWFHKNDEILNEFKKRGMIKYEAINNFENGNKI